ncbi:NfeD family protein [Parvularcula oceani]|uniref:NfeD family protein n=1 Tax=Parvularcula oceani TaxID=1247963 RepID=UPI00068FC8FD|nr:nodulation protein NfeD [Parvularcula oceani]
MSARSILGLLPVLAILFAWNGHAAAQRAEGPRTATVVSLDGPITPVSAELFEDALARAAQSGAQFLLVEIDTPGGLMDSMKSIVKATLASPVPVVTYVSPDGARSASAGLYIMYAAHFSAMAPSTNTGSATPVGLGGEPAGEDGGDTSNEASMRAKVIEDAVAYIRALAEERGRNAEWAEDAVRPPSANVPAREALELGVIDIVAQDRADLLAQLDGRTVETASGPVTFETADLAFDRVEPTLVQEILSFFADPNVAAILMTLGVTGLIVELWNPGSIFPGLMGAICLLLALYSFQVLPFEGVYLALLLLGAVLMTVEAFTPTFGLVGLAGLILLGIGLYFLFPGELRIALWVVAGLLLLAAAFLGTALLTFMRTRRRKPMTGDEALPGHEARVDVWEGDSGWVILDGERWRARAAAVLAPGDQVVVTEADGLVLDVVPLRSLGGTPRRTPAQPDPAPHS